MTELISIQLMGEVRLQPAASTPSVPMMGGRRGVIVLARLATDAGRAVDSEQLARVVWSDDRPRAWRASLRNAIADLRAWLHRLGAQMAIVSSPRGYRLDLPNGATVDLHLLFEAAAGAATAREQGNDAEALALVHDVLRYIRPGFLVDAEAPWVIETRKRIAATVSTLFLVGAAAALELGQATRAEVLSCRAIEWDELREDGHRLLMRAMIASGNRGAALEAYERCRTALVERLGSEPSAATQALFHELLAEDPPAGIFPIHRPLSLMQAAAPLVGRRAELRRVDALFDLARRDGPVVVRVRGEAGIGKTRFAAEVAVRLGARGVPALYGRADDQFDVPYRPLLESIDTHLSLLGTMPRRALLGAHASQLANLVPAIRDVLPIEPSSGIRELDRNHLTAGISEILAAVAAPVGALLILDDMQWSSRPTVDLLDQLGQRMRGVSVLVLALYRSGRPAEPVGVPEAGHVITLEGLALDDVKALAESVEPREPATSLHAASEVWSDTGGNPLYITEILRSGGTGPRSTGDTPGPRTWRLRRLVRNRVAALPRRTRTWLDIAAVAGLEFEPALVRIAGQLSEHAAAAALTDAEAEGLVTAATSDRSQRSFRHALVRQCLLDDLDDEPGYVMSIHQRLGRALEGRHDTPAPLLAHHANAAAPLGDWRRAVRYSLAAARAAADALVHDDVITICTRALAVLTDAGDPDPRARLRLSVLLGTAFCGLRDPAGPATLEAAFEQAIDLDEVQLAAEAALGFSGAGAAGDEMALDTEHLELYERALVALGDGSDRLRAQLLGRLSTAYGWLRDGESGRRYAEQALVLAREVGDVAAIATVLISTRRGLSGTGRPAEERAIEDELMDIAHSLDDPGMATSAWLWRFESAVELGRGAELDTSLDHALRGVTDFSPSTNRYTAAYAHAARLLLRGKVDAADTAVEQAFMLGRDLGIDPLVSGGIRMIQLMGVRHEQGRLAELRDELAEYFGRSAVPEWEGAVAFADAELGRFDTVDGYLQKVFTGYEAGGVRTGAGIAFAVHMANPVARVGDTARAGILYDVLLPYRGLGTYISYFTGPVDHALGLLARTLGREAQARRHLADAATFCVALGAPRWTARCEALLATPAASSELIAPSRSGA